MNVLHSPANAKAPPGGALHCRDGHMRPFLCFCILGMLLLSTATLENIACLFWRVNLHKLDQETMFSIIQISPLLFVIGTHLTDWLPPFQTSSTGSVLTREIPPDSE